MGLYCATGGRKPSTQWAPFLSTRTRLFRPGRAREVPTSEAIRIDKRSLPNLTPREVAPHLGPDMRDGPKHGPDACRRSPGRAPP